MNEGGKCGGREFSIHVDDGSRDFMSDDLTFDTIQPIVLVIFQFLKIVK